MSTFGSNTGHRRQKIGEEKRLLESEKENKRSFKDRESNHFRVEDFEFLCFVRHRFDSDLQMNIVNS
ncbi:hypothetical protein MRB53_024639 [Persea americana]|uniref:Uncharacterized protein n=1 Tax=Persea americana TaxID=3435 RepID=A0ACC2LCY9_PERAE|nr:hypothetical protein MRB53_024639 [Persea americana]